MLRHEKTVNSGLAVSRPLKCCGLLEWLRRQAAPQQCVVVLKGSNGALAAFLPYWPLALQCLRFTRFLLILSGVPSIESDDYLEYWCWCKHLVIGNGFRCHQHHTTNLKNDMEPPDNHQSGPYIVFHAAFKFVKIGLDRLLRDICTEQNARA